MVHLRNAAVQEVCCGLMAGQRRQQVALRLLHVADLFLRDREVACHPALPASAFARRSAIVSVAGFGTKVRRRVKRPPMECGSLVEWRLLVIRHR